MRARIPGIAAVLGLAAVLGGPLAARDDASTVPFQKRFDEVAKTQVDAQVEALAEQWKSAEPTNPDVYVAVANYYFVKARKEKIEISRKPPEGEEFSLSDATGNVVSSLGSVVVTDPATAAHATAALREAAQKFPDRLDIWFGLAHVLQEVGSFDAQYAALEQAFAYATSHAKGLKWRHGEALPEDPAKFIPETAQGFLTHYYDLATAEDDERFLRLAKLIAASYPKHPYAVNAIGGYYALKEQWTEAASYLEKAHDLDPHDALVLMNLGLIYTKMNDKAKAKGFYEKVLASDADRQIQDEARQKLVELQ